MYFLKYIFIFKRRLINHTPIIRKNITQIRRRTETTRIRISICTIIILPKRNRLLKDFLCRIRLQIIKSGFSLQAFQEWKIILQFTNKPCFLASCIVIARKISIRCNMGTTRASTFCIRNFCRIGKSVRIHRRCIPKITPQVLIHISSSIITFSHH